MGINYIPPHVPVASITAAKSAREPASLTDNLIRPDIINNSQQARFSNSASSLMAQVGPPLDRELGDIRTMPSELSNSSTQLKNLSTEEIDQKISEQFGETHLVNTIANSAGNQIGFRIDPNEFPSLEKSQLIQIKGKISQAVNVLFSSDPEFREKYLDGGVNLIFNISQSNPNQPLAAISARTTAIAKALCTDEDETTCLHPSFGPALLAHSDSYQALTQQHNNYAQFMGPLLKDSNSNFDVEAIFGIDGRRQELFPGHFEYLAGIELAKDPAYEVETFEASVSSILQTQSSTLEYKPFEVGSPIIPVPVYWPGTGNTLEVDLNIGNLGQTEIDSSTGEIVSWEHKSLEDLSVGDLITAMKSIKHLQTAQQSLNLGSQLSPEIALAALSNTKTDLEELASKSSSDSNLRLDLENQINNLNHRLELAKYLKSSTTQTHLGKHDSGLDVYAGVGNLRPAAINEQKQEQIAEVNQALDLALLSPKVSNAMQAMDPDIVLSYNRSLDIFMLAQLYAANAATGDGQSEFNRAVEVFQDLHSQDQDIRVGANNQAIENSPLVVAHRFGPLKPTFFIRDNEHHGIRSAGVAASHFDPVLRKAEITASIVETTIASSRMLNGQAFHDPDLEAREVKQITSQELERIVGSLSPDESELQQALKNTIESYSHTLTVKSDNTATPGFSNH